MNVRLDLREEFLEGELEADRSLALRQFQQLKKQITQYMETKSVKGVTSDSTQTIAQSFNDLDHNFMVNYEEW